MVVGRGVLHYPHHPLTEKTSCRAQIARVSVLFSLTFTFLAKRGIPIVIFAIRTAVPGIHPLEIAMATPAPLPPHPTSGRRSARDACHGSARYSRAKTSLTGILCDRGRAILTLPSQEKSSRDDRDVSRLESEKIKAPKSARKTPNQPV